MWTYISKNLFFSFSVIFTLTYPSRFHSYSFCSLTLNHHLSHLLSQQHTKSSSKTGAFTPSLYTNIPREENNSINIAISIDLWPGLAYVIHFSCDLDESISGRFGGVKAICNDAWRRFSSYGYPPEVWIPSGEEQEMIDLRGYFEDGISPSEGGIMCHPVRGLG